MNPHDWPEVSWGKHTHNGHLQSVVRVRSLWRNLMMQMRSDKVKICLGGKKRGTDGKRSGKKMQQMDAVNFFQLLASLTDTLTKLEGWATGRDSLTLSPNQYSAYRQGRCSLLKVTADHKPLSKTRRPSEEFRLTHGYMMWTVIGWQQIGEWIHK